MTTSNSAKRESDGAPSGKFRVRLTGAGLTEPWLKLSTPDLFPSRSAIVHTIVSSGSASEPQNADSDGSLELLWRQLPELSRLFRSPPLRPGVQTLAEAVGFSDAPDFSAPGSPNGSIGRSGWTSVLPQEADSSCYPLITRQPLITDDGNRLSIVHLFMDTFWRWRRTPTEDVYDQFWTQLIRELGKQSEQIILKDEPKTGQEGKSNLLPPRPLEYQNTAADRSWLEAVAQSTGGRCFDASKTAEATRSIPTNIPALKLEQPPVPIWNQYWLLILLYIFLIIDWTRFVVWRI